MKFFVNHRACKVVLVSAVAAFIAGCGAAQGPISPSASNVSNLSRHVGPLDGASTEVDVHNGWTAQIAGSGSSDCWSISPALPLVNPGDTDGPVTLTYHASTSCGVPSGIGITYGPAVSTGPTCTFNVVYDARFTFSVTQSARTDCTIAYPPYGVNAIFNYAQITTGAKRSPGSRSMH